MKRSKYQVIADRMMRLSTPELAQLVATFASRPYGQHFRDLLGALCAENAKMRQGEIEDLLKKKP